MPTKDRKKLYNKIITQMFGDKVPEGHELRAYYSVMMMGMKKYKGKYSIRLQYGYKGRNPVNSDPLEIDNLERALKLYGLLAEFSINETKTTDGDKENLLDQL